jgi:hypothetical protein
MKCTRHRCHAAFEQDRGDRTLQAGVGVADHQLHPAQPAGLQATQERGPERPVLGVADVEPEHLTPPVGGDTGSDDHRLGHHAAVHPGLAVGGVEEHVGVVDPGQGPVPERAHLLIEVRADPRHLGLADPARTTQRLDQVVDLPGRHSVQVGLHDHREQGLVDPTAPLEQRGEEGPGPQLRDP